MDDFTTIVGAWLIFSFVVGAIASSRGKSFGMHFLLSLLLSPLIGLIVALAGGDGQKRAPCWQCKELVIEGAAKCKHCGADLVWNQPAAG